MENKITSIFRDKKLISLAIVAAAAAAAWFFWSPKDNGGGAVVYTYGTVSRGMILQSVAGTGQIAATRESTLKSKISGKVVEVKVAAGQAVKEGDIIARIDDADARGSASDARAALESAKLSLEKLNEPADELESIQAKNALDQASESLASDKEDLANKYEQGFNAAAAAFADLPAIVSGLQDIVAGASSYITQSNSTYLDYYADSIKIYDSQAPELATKAVIAYRNAKAQYEKNFQDYKSASRFSSENEIEALISQTYSTTQKIAEALRNTANAIQRYEDVLNDQNLAPQAFADTQLATLSGYTAKNTSHLNDLLSASQSIADAKIAIVNDERAIDEKTKSLAKISEPADEIDVRTQQLAVAQKERALAEALETIEDYVVRSPFAGTVASLEVEKGDDLASGGTVATVITDSRIATITLNEVDIAKVKAGQKVTMTFSAVDGLTATGKVVEVGAIGSVSQGVVSYSVTIALDTENEQIKSGMSIAAAIITQTKQDVLLAPSTAVKTDDAGPYVLVPGNDPAAAPIKQAVTTGLSDDTNTEIAEGLAEGGKIVVSSAKQNTSKTSSASNSGSAGRNNAVFNFGGMGGPPR